MHADLAQHPGIDRADLARLSLNSATTRSWSLTEVVNGCLRAGVPAVGLWRDQVEEVGTARAAGMVADAGLRVSSLCRGGFLTAADRPGIDRALHDNRAAIEQAAGLGTRELIMVVGGLVPGDVDISGARARVADRLADLVPVAREHGVRLALEPLHPMYAADRAVLSTLEQALDMAAPHAPETVGVVVDTFHLWWDPRLPRSILRAGNEGRLAAYQVSDWILPIAADALLSRGMVGDGFIDFAAITGYVTDAGYTGDVEVEIFNAGIWEQDCDDVVTTVKDRYRALVLPAL